MVNEGVGLPVPQIALKNFVAVRPASLFVLRCAVWPFIGCSLTTADNSDNTACNFAPAPFSNPMIRFSAAKSETPETAPPSPKGHEPHPLDALTGGAFSAPTSGERAARVRQWLANDPSAEKMQEVFKELSVKDKGAAKPLREKLDELRRAKGQEALASEWAEKAKLLLTQVKINIADALAWQRDAAKAGAPLSREPLASVKLELAERVRVIEDLQHRTQVQREAAVLLAQRIEVLSTKSWKDAQAALEVLGSDVEHWKTQAQVLTADVNWPSVDAKFPPLLDSSQSQLGAVWSAFQAAVALTVAAAEDAAAPLPPVRLWADELRAARGVALEPEPVVPRPRIDPEVLKEMRAKAMHKVKEALHKVEQEVAEGHGKASAGAAAALRNALKENVKLIDDKLEAQAHAALAAAGELEGWQRWRADQLREELVGKAEGLLKRPEGQAMGGRKMQETLRALREQWKQTDQGGVPNHALWKRFDEACNEAHKVVEAWLDKLKSEAAEHRAQRLALIDEVKAWAAANPQPQDGRAHDWKAVSRSLHQFGDRWREAGHLSEKAFAELQPLWQEAIASAAAPLEALQKSSLEQRHALIEEAKVLGAAPMLHIDSVKALQQRWQAEAQAVPLERRHEQKLWDAFRKPIDDAFNRKTMEREKAAAALGEHDRAVLDAAKALEAANAKGDAGAIRGAMAALDAALRGQTLASDRAATAAAAVPTVEAPVAVVTEPPLSGAGDVTVAASESETTAAPSAVAPVVPAKPVKPVIAMRGDDRPGMRKSEPSAPTRGSRPDSRSDSRGPRPDSRDGARLGFGDRGPRFSERAPAPDRGPRLGDAAFRAQREAMERAEFALKKLAAQAHGEALTHLLTAWEKRDAALVPSVGDFGPRVSTAVRGSWTQALGAAPKADDAAGVAQTLLRLEMAAEVPTPAEHMNERRMLQLQLLTRRNDPAPVQTWAQDMARLLANTFDNARAHRVQTALKVLLKR